MPDTLTILEGLAGGAEQAASNIYNISQARGKLKREDEAFQLDKKVKEAAIKKAEFEYGPEALALDREKLKAEVAAQKSKVKIDELTISQKEAEEKRKLREHETGMKIIGNMFPDLFAPETDTRGAAEGGPGVAAAIEPDLYEPPALPEGVSFDFGPVSLKGVAKKEDPIEKDYRRYLETHIESQAELVGSYAKYRTEPMTLEEYREAVSPTKPPPTEEPPPGEPAAEKPAPPARGAAVELTTENIITSMDDYDDVDEALTELGDLKDSYDTANKSLADFIDIEQFVAAFTSKFGAEYEDEIRKVLGGI